MRHIFNFTRVALLVVLIFGSLYQTGKLWLDVPSDRNFFYTVLPDRFQPKAAVVGANAALPSPKQVGLFIGDSDVEYTMIRRGASDYDGLIESSMSVLSEVIKTGKFIERYEEDQVLWDEQHYFISMPFDVTADMLVSNTGQSSSKLELPDRTNTVIVVPADSQQAKLSVYLTEGMTGEVYEYSVDKSNLSIQNEILYKYLVKTRASDKNPAYISTRKNNMGHYSSNLLLPVGTGEIHYHDELYWEVPYVKDKQIDEVALTAFVAAFFNNPDVANRTAFKEEVRFSDSSVIVKYNNDGLLEYVKGYTEKDDEADVAKALGVAGEFLSRRVENQLVEYYLQDYEQDEKGTHFYYDTGYNGFPVTMDADIKAYYGMDYAMIVTVAGDDVVGFKWIIRQIPDVMPQSKTLAMPYQDALDIALSESVGSESLLEDMYLGYRWDKNQSGLTLNWILKNNEGTRFVEVSE